MKFRLLSFLIFFSISTDTFSQQALISYCIDELNFKPFREMGISEITITGYELDKHSKFHRADKVLYIYDKATGVLTHRFLNQKNKPYKKMSDTWFRHDSLDNLCEVSDSGKQFDLPGDCNSYIFDELHRIKKFNGDNYFYDADGKLIRTISDTMVYSINIPVTITEYSYVGDTLKSELRYRTTYGNENRQGGKLKEYIYKEGKIKGYLLTEKYFEKPREPELHLFEADENTKSVKESTYINGKLTFYLVTKFGK
jgi:hypothetical protein